MSPVEIAWVAGLMEGEGYFGLKPGKRRRDGTRTLYCAVALNMVDEEIVRRIHKIVGSGTFHGPYVKKQNPRAQPYFCWRNDGDPGIEFIKLVQPHMGSRRQAQMQRALDHHRVVCL